MLNICKHSFITYFFTWLVLFNSIMQYVISLTWLIVSGPSSSILSTSSSRLMLLRSTIKGTHIIAKKCNHIKIYIKNNNMSSLELSSFSSILFAPNHLLGLTFIRMIFQHKRFFRNNFVTHFLCYTAIRINFCSFPTTYCFLHNMKHSWNSTETMLTLFLN